MRMIMDGVEEGIESSDEAIRDVNLFENLSYYFDTLISVLGGLSEAEVGDGRYLGSEQFLINLGPSERPRTPGHRDRGRIQAGQVTRLASALESAWSTFPGYEGCIEAFISSDIYSMELNRATEMGIVTDEEEYENLINEEALPKLFSSYLDDVGQLQFDPEKFGNTYREFENYLLKDQLDFKSLAILNHFEMDSEEILLNDNLKIRSLTEEESSSISRRLTRRIEFEDEDPTVYAIEYFYSVEKFGETQTEAAINTFNNVILILRLYGNKGDVGFPFIVTRSTSRFEQGREINTFSPVNEFIGTTYALSEEECNSFIDFWNAVEYQVDQPDDNYRVALDKFSNSFERANQSDRLLDCVIALEALYLKSGEFQEMSYRLSQRGALLLGSSIEEALQIRNSLKEAYNQRSRLVHGSTADVDKEFIMELHNLTRESLNRFLIQDSQGNEHDDILDTLDENAVTPSERGE